MIVYRISVNTQRSLSQSDSRIRKKTRESSTMMNNGENVFYLYVNNTAT